MLKGVAGGAINKTTRKAKAPSASWAAQDLGIISNLISAHLYHSEGGGASDPNSTTARAEAAVPEAGRTAASECGGGDDNAAATSGDARVALVVDELAMTIADQALGGTSLGD